MGAEVNRRGFFKGLAATIGAAAVKVGARVFFASNNAQLHRAMAAAKPGDKILLKAGKTFDFGWKP